MKFIFVLIFLFSKFSFSEENEISSEGITLPILVTQKVSFAYIDFLKRAKDTSCFEVYVKKEREYHTVGFFWKESVRIENDQLIIGGVDKSQECGKEFVYKFDSLSGKLIDIEDVYRK